MNSTTARFAAPSFQLLNGLVLMATSPSGPSRLRITSRGQPTASISPGRQLLSKNGRRGL
jgi:hypothetical protein